MNFSDFTDLIKKNSEEGKSTEFFKFTMPIDDFRISNSVGFGMDESFFADYDKVSNNYIIYYPDKENKFNFKSDDVEDEFYNNGWGGYIHK